MTFKQELQRLNNDILVSQKKELELTGKLMKARRELEKGKDSLAKAITERENHVIQEDTQYAETCKNDTARKAYLKNAVNNDKYITSVKDVLDENVKNVNMTELELQETKLNRKYAERELDIGLTLLKAGITE